jgi:spermidine synthase
VAFLYPLFFISGIPALLYQVVWQRALFTIYGTNTESATAVVAAFLLGLGLGAFAGGWAASGWPTRLLIIYGVVEFIIGLFGLVSLQIFDWVGLRFTAASMAQTGTVAFALVVLPTLLMGATLPILVAFLVAQRAHVGSSVGILYFVNTLGSAFACVLAAEFLMEALGQRGTVAIAAILNLVVAGGAIALGRMLRGTEGTNEPVSQEAMRGTGAFLLSKPRASLLAAVVGYLSLSFEILWFRAYAFLSGGSARDFAHLLAFFLAGIALGGLVGRPLSRLTDRSPAHARLIPTVLLVVAAVAALFCAPGMGLIPGSVPSWVGLPLVMLVAALWAALFPVIAHLSVAPDRGVGAGIGQLYLANVIGAVAGCLFTGFVLMDHLGTRELTIALTVVGVAVAWVLWSEASVRPKLAAAVGLAVLSVTVGVLAIPLYANLYERLLYRRPVSDSQGFDHVVETKGGVAAVTSDGVVYGGGVYDGRISIDFVNDVNGIFRPFSVSAFHPAPRRVLMIGLSAGAWAEVMANHPQLNELVVVEINPGYLKLIPQYRVVAGLLANSHVKIVIDDGRRWLRSYRSQGFDVVMMNTTFHWRSCASNVLSVEFLRLVKSVLNPGGILMFNATGSAEVHRTAATVFPHAMRFANMMVASRDPIQIDVARWEAVMKRYVINGIPVVGDGELDEAALARNKARLTAVDKPAASADDWDSVETRQHILARTEGLRVVTDDNMGLEWRRR